MAFNEKAKRGNTLRPSLDLPNKIQTDPLSKMYGNNN